MAEGPDTAADAFVVDEARIQPVVASAVRDPGVRIVDLAALTGGASRRTYRFFAVGSDGSRRGMVLQVSAPAALDNEELQRPPGVEADLVRVAGAHGVPVPELLASSIELEPFGGRYLLTDEIGGETIARRLLRDDRYSRARGVLVGQCARALAGIHAIDPAEIPDLPDVDPVERTRITLDEVGVSVPVFELAFRWLERERPDPRPSAVVHGDFRLGNLIVDDAGLAAVIDWELCHLGQAPFDLAWMCVRAWRFGGPGAVAGLGERRELLDAYHDAGGAEIEPEELRWWEVAATLTWGVICASQAYRHLSGSVRSQELAAIGRRVIENEWDLLELIR